MCQRLLLKSPVIQKQVVDAMVCETIPENDHESSNAIFEAQWLKKKTTS